MQQLPEIPPLDVIVGVASAGLLLAALVYLIRSRPEHSLIEVGARSKLAELSLFAPLPSGYLTSRLSFLGSLFGHLFWHCIHSLGAGSPPAQANVCSRKT